jgi:hypothetical protein
MVLLRRLRRAAKSPLVRAAIATVPRAVADAVLPAATDRSGGSAIT